MNLNSNKIISFSILLLILVFLTPYFTSIRFEIDYLQRLKNEDFQSALIRSTVFGLLSSIISIIIGFFGAYLIRKITIYSILGKLISILLIPVILGNTSVAFISKLFLSDSNLLSSLISSGTNGYIVLLLLMQCWQFSFLFLYLFWLTFQNIPKPINEYSLAIHIPKYREIKDILIPKAKNLVILLFLIGFIFSFYEDVKNQFVLKASQGTNSELINHWINRNYHSDLLINNDIAVSTAYSNSFFIMSFILLVAGASLYFINLLITKFIQLPIGNKQLKNKNLFQMHYFNVIMIVILVSLVLYPILSVFWDSKISLMTEYYFLIKPFVLTLIAALLSTITAIAFGFFSRISWKNMLSKFDRKSLTFFLLIYFVSLVPSIVVCLCGFYWMAKIGYSISFIINIVWIVGHIILIFSLLASFVLVTHFSVKNEEIDYLISYSISRNAIFQVSFFKRFTLEYVLTILIAFSFIWNEANFNHVLSDYVPSFSSNIELLIDSRGANYDKAFVFLLISALIATISIIIWIRVVTKASNKVKLS